MLKKKELSALPIPPLPEEFAKKKKAGWVALAREHGDILAVTVYEIPQKTVKARFFTDGVNSIKQHGDNWETEFLSSILRGGPSFYYTRGIGTDYHDEDSERVAKAYFKALDVYTDYGDILKWCDEFDGRKGERKRRQQFHNEEERRKRHFEAMPPLPAGIDAFADSKMPQYLFYSKITKGKRRVKCSACGKTYTVGKGVPQHKAACTCRKCGAAVTWQKEWLPTKGVSEKVWTVVRKGDDLYYRVTEVMRWFGDGHKKEYRHCDERRMLETVENNKRRVYNYVMVYATYYYGWNWKRCTFGSEYLYDAWIYTENLKDVLGERFCNVDVTAFDGIRYEGDLFYILQCLREKPIAEYFAKAGMWRLLQQQRILNYDIEVPSHLRRLARKYDVTFHELVQLEKTGVVSDDRFEAVRRIRCGFFGSGEMMNRLGIDKYIRLFGKWNAMYPDRKFTQIEQWYKDYLSMCDELHVDTSNKSVRYPRDLKEEHDRLANRITLARNKEENEHFAKRCAELYKGMHGYSNEKYTVVFPQLRTDLIAEGQSLCHCVGGTTYRDAHLGGERMIFFIRAAEKPDKPLYTLQANVHDGTIIQLYGYGDKPAPAEVRAFCERFLRQLWTGPKKAIA